MDANFVSDFYFIAGMQWILFVVVFIMLVICLYRISILSNDIEEKEDNLIKENLKIRSILTIQSEFADISRKILLGKIKILEEKMDIWTHRLDKIINKDFYLWKKHK
jgi:hypothetical protein